MEAHDKTLSRARLRAQNQDCRVSYKLGNLSSGSIEGVAQTLALRTAQFKLSLSVWASSFALRHKLASCVQQQIYSWSQGECP
jgi:hypothetical protein